MVKCNAVILLIIIFSYSYGQKTSRLKNDTIIWREDYKLTKDVFKGHKRLDKKYGGEAATGLYMYFKEIDGDLKIKVEAIFSKSNSCMKLDSKYAMKHEQLHFDITELYARKLREDLTNTDFTQVKNMETVITKLYKKNLKELEAEQDKYDKDTEHGLNSAKQEVWNNSIQEQLNELSAYTSTVVNVKKN